MKSSIVNQYGKYLFGTEHDLIVDAFQKDKTSLTIGGVEVNIVGATRDKHGHLIIKVKVVRL